MKQPFKTEELKVELERTLGFPLRSLVRLDGASALNFKAVREGDGLFFLVKCFPPERRNFLKRFLINLEALRGAKVPERLFGDCGRIMICGFEVICISWCEGRRLMPDQLTREQLLAFLDEYQHLSAAFQTLSQVNGPDPLPAFREVAVRSSAGIWGRAVRRLIDRAVPVDSVIYRKETLKVIHADFHHGNFLFVDGAVSGFFDLEELCRGYPAEDIVRYIVCAAEHLPWYALCRRRRLLRVFGEAVHHLSYPVEEWLLAVNGLLVRKIAKKVIDRRVGLGCVANLLYRAVFYRKLCRVLMNRRKPA